jgi:SanA protein
VLLVGVAVPVGWLGWQAAQISGTAGPRTYDAVAKLPRNRVALVLGCAPELEGGGANPFFAERVAAAAAVFRAGKADYLLVSGDNGRATYDEPTAMRGALVAAGVPAGRITLDYAGFRTLDSVVRAREVFGLERFTVISQRFHNERAIYLAAANGIEAVGYNAADVDGARATMAYWREWLARMKAVLDVRVLHKHPRFLGPPVAIGAL